jgi:putative ABC transport system permease protein
MLHLLRSGASTFRKSPALSAVLVLGLSLAVVTWGGTQIALEALVQRPTAGEAKLADWVRLEPPPRFADVEPPSGALFDLDAANRMSWRDYEVLSRLAGPTRHGGGCMDEGVVVAGGRLREATLDFLDGDPRIFDLPPWRFGGPWEANGRESDPRVAVINAAANEMLFDGGNSVGGTVLVGAEELRIVGVLEKPPGRHPSPAVVLLPFQNAILRRIRPSIGLENGEGAPTFDDLRASEVRWLSLLVEFDDERSEQRFADGIAAYATEQRATGRPVVRGTLVRAHALRMAVAKRHPSELLFSFAALLLLGASVLNASRLLLVKYQEGDMAMGIHRAFGASRRVVLLQHLLEAALAGGAAALVAIGGTAVAVRVMNAMLPIRPADYALGPRIAAEELALAVGAAVLAAVYPAWSSSRRTPAAMLRRR